jgi:hypothetical protein
MRSIHNKIILDKRDTHLLKDYNWSLGSGGYASGRVNGKIKKLHHIIMPSKEGFEIDHINRNKLDNRKKNLRYVTHQQNMMNSSKKKDNTSGFRGVWWNKRDKKWVSYIKFNNKRKCVGYFSDIEEAARAYKNKAVELFQEYLGEI